MQQGRPLLRPLPVDPYLRPALGTDIPFAALFKKQRMAAPDASIVNIYITPRAAANEIGAHQYITALLGIVRRQEFDVPRITVL
ncbi:hypothetical protein SDC9_147778 [bioreactor metagenome]|uniref:Uncharacterized protein n=1 Tax=bioreactor metagenome TaxID=1076179 RepID=A0A645EH27_9ZZZZ